ncbi:MAG: Vitamin B12 transporter BtuB [Steroidobacteraceae bacterium]|nr:Vitamin B12 transporter BtuB [Steroidobacteraceae bacterium]
MRIIHIRALSQSNKQVPSMISRAVPVLLAGLVPLAASSADAPAQLELVTITATRIATRIMDVPATVTVKDTAALDRELVFNLEDVLRYEPGVSMRNEGGRFGASGPSIRGIGGNRVLMEVDGVRLPDAFTIGSYANAGRDMLDTELLKRVEIVRGSASSLYGSDAIGGVFAFTTRDPVDLLDGDRRFGLSTKGGYSGWNDATMAGATAAGRAGEWSALLSYTHRDGHELDNAGTRGGVGALRTRPVPQDVYSDSVLAKIVFDASDSQRFRLTFEGTRDDTATDVLTAVSTTAPLPGRTQTTGLVGSDAAVRSRVAFDHEFTPAAVRWFERGEWRVYRQVSETTQETFEQRLVASLAGAITPQARQREFDFDQETRGAEATLFSRFAAGATDHVLAFGLEFVETDTAQLRRGMQTNLLTASTSTTILPDVFPVRDFPLTTTRQASAYVQDEIRIGAFTITPGVRFDDYALRPQIDAIFAADNPGFAATDIDERNVSPKLGVLYRATANTALYLNYAAGFRAPPSDDVNIGFENLAFGYTAIANPDLKSETSNGFELGWRLTDQRGGYVALAGYYNLYDDFIESRVGTFDPVSGLVVFQSRNLSEVRIYGAEIAAGLPLEALAPALSGFSVRLAAAWSRGENRSANGAPLNSVEPPQGVVGLAYRAPSRRWGAELVSTLTGAVERADHSAGALFTPGGHATFDLLADVQLTSRVRFNAGVFNLVDRTCWEWSDVSGRFAGDPALERYTRPGRTAGATIRYTW